ncbi:MAG: hypothetical protein HFG27_02810 [Provencibacterium sp.]|nr:hypothetical protein [Provencibacterium sp.]
MKRALIGGFLALIGTIWGLAVLNSASNNLTGSWSTPPGRLLTTVAEQGTAFILVCALLLLALGLVMMGIEYFRK